MAIIFIPNKNKCNKNSKNNKKNNKYLIMNND